jgi:hypothetical protein
LDQAFPLHFVHVFPDPIVTIGKACTSDIKGTKVLDVVSVGVNCKHHFDTFSGIHGVTSYQALILAESVGQKAHPVNKKDDFV